MKNKFFILCLLLFFILPQISKSEIFEFDVKSINIQDKGNLVLAKEGKAVSENNNIEIIAENFKYVKNLEQLEASNGNAIIKSQNLDLKFKLIKFDIKNNIITASNGIEIDDLKKSLNIQGENIVFDRGKNLLFSNTDSKIKDKYSNLINSSKFDYKINQKNLNIFEATMKDTRKNTFEIESAYIDTQSNLLIGKNIIINLNNEYFNKDNEPRLKGEKIKYENNITEISNGTFTACKKTENCPPWELSADKIKHDSQKKIISYKNVWLKVYDVPIVYFPKFFHPDPTVKRQSGFLMPTFENTPNNNTYFSVPYFKVLAENKDLTFTPRFYAKDQFLLQNEYRERKKNSNSILDTSLLFNSSNNINGHFFYNLDKNLNIKNFKNSNLKFNLEQVSDDTYLRANNLNSPIIKDYDLTETSLKLNMSSEDTIINSELKVYQKLNETHSSNKYEYILPKIELTKNIENKTKLNGNFEFKTNNYIHNYQTNIYDRVNTNNLIFKSSPTITKNGYYNNYEFIIKNSNTNSENSKLNKEGEDLYLSGLFQFNSSYPLIKKNALNKSLIKPKLTLKLSPGHTKDLSDKEYKLNADNLFDLDRISSKETLESGMSIAYGIDYSFSEEKNNKEIFSLKLANNLRLNENDDLERNNQLGSNVSNFFGEISYSPLSFLNTKYNFSTKNNLSDINYQNFIAEIKFNKFINTFDYLRQEGDKNSYYLNETKYNFNDKNNLSFSTRENLKTDLTEYYNLIYQYKNDCLAASLEYQKEYYSDRDIKPKESIFLKLTIIPFGESTTPNLN